MDEPLVGGRRGAKAKNVGPAPAVASAASQDVGAARFLNSPPPDPDVGPQITGEAAGDGVQRVELHLVHSPTQAQCDFWIGLTAPGPHAPLSLLGEPELSQVLHIAASEGLNETGPLLLADATAVPPRSVLLMPVPVADFRSRTLWVVELAQTLRAWSPRDIGFYMAPEALPREAGLDLLASVLRELIMTSKATNFYLLTGAHGLNPLLNAALRLKADLQSDSLSLFVYH